MAAEAGDNERASEDFAEALAAAPGNIPIASQALAYAVPSGDWPLALAAARQLEQAGQLDPDERFFLLSEALRRRDWTEAARQVDTIEKEEMFAFAVPVLRAWLAVGANGADPAATLRGLERGPAAVYAAEHMPLVLAATGRLDNPSDLVRITEAMGGRAQRLRIGMAAALARQNKKEAALALLAGDEPPVAAARRLVEAGEPVPGAIADAASGTAELFVRLALDLQLQDLPDLAIGFARLATFLAPANGEAWLIAAELLEMEGRHEAALSLLEQVGDESLYASEAQEQRIRFLVAGGDSERALRQAQAAVQSGTASAEDWGRLGEIYSGLGRPADAADAYGRALAVHNPESSIAEWALWLLRGSALEQAGNWVDAKACLHQAYRLAPGQPVVLNHLGYSQLVRRENMAEAERLIREANRLAPDNAAIADSLGWALFLRGEHEEALPLLESAAQAAPADVEIHEHLGDAYYAAGRRIEARFAWKAALVHAEDEDATRLRAKLETGLIPRLAAR